MADEAFALSPISARATLPSEADYDAISEAFMETLRGRWFLGEYAKRNRNADTRMVLDAVARIEQNLAAQKNAAPDDGLAEALAAIGAAVEEAKAAASAALGSAAADTPLASIRDGAKVIRETLLRLREIGADGRIYDLMDFQVSAIEAGCGRLAASDANAALSAAFDRIEARIRQFADDDAAQPPAAFDAVPAETASPSQEAAVASPSGDAAATVRTEPVISDTETALDDVLDMIALEMAAPDPAEDDAAELYMAEPDPVEPVTAQAPEPAIAPQPSLGASLIAQGIVLRPAPSAADPLAPIRRMSQAEKIAFFS